MLRFGTRVAKEEFYGVNKPINFGMLMLII